MTLRDMLRQPGSLKVGGAYDALSARLVASSGLDAVWISSLCVSAALKLVPDANFIGMSEMLEVGRAAVGCVDIPVIVDCENGYGDVHNVAYAIEQFERAGVAAVAIEDNVYPKRNSFYNVDRGLVSTSEMVEKVKIACETRTSDQFLVIGRTEALIAGLGVSEAVERATAFELAGADALIVHGRTWQDVHTFLDQWQGTAPLAAIPTTYVDADPSYLTAMGFKMIIYANQALRAAVHAMEATLARIQLEDVSGIDQQLASLTHLESLVNVMQTVGKARRLMP